MYVNTLQPGESCVCPKCNGSGTFYVADRSGKYPNGAKPVGDCYSCRGTGKHTYADSKRCATYWNKYAHLGA